MITKKILNPDRIRCIDGGFSFIPHRFLTDGFLQSLQQQQLMLYLFLVLAADRHGLSYYSYGRICSFLNMALPEKTLKAIVAYIITLSDRDSGLTKNNSTPFPFATLCTRIL